MKILFVCFGNICRSPMAERIMNDLLQKSGKAPLSESAATSQVEEGNPIYPPAQRVLRAHGISPENKTARVLKADDYNNYDLIIGMDDSNIRDMHHLFGGDPQGKVRKLLSFCGEDGDVVDPWYTGDFETTWNEIHRGCTALLKQIHQ